MRNNKCYLKYKSYNVAGLQWSYMLHAAFLYTAEVIMFLFICGHRNLRYVIIIIYYITTMWFKISRDTYLFTFYFHHIITNFIKTL